MFECDESLHTTLAVLPLWLNRIVIFMIIPFAPQVQAIKQSTAAFRSSKLAHSNYY